LIVAAARRRGQKRLVVRRASHWAVDMDRDPNLGGTLLLTERDALMPILRRTESAAFDRMTICPGWSVRDVLAHCAAALTRLADGSLHKFSPADNEADVAARRSWSTGDVLAELEGGYVDAANALVAAGGRFDAVALGEWIHGGDVRDGLDQPAAYASEGADAALILLAEWSGRKNVPSTLVHLPDRELRIGADADGSADLTTDVETLFRLCAGRRPDPGRFRLTGAIADQYLVFR
jgi:uncharacterized protein (TIGR03083 family)